MRLEGLGKGPGERSSESSGNVYSVYCLAIVVVATVSYCGWLALEPS